VKIERGRSYVGSYAIGDRTLAVLKLQDGCDYNVLLYISLVEGF